jgi:predicted AlkP superfamily phosphohydrolase/phosphomutase
MDGVPHSLVTRLTDEGVMPRAAEIFGGGTLHRMKVTLPEVSAVSWTSFMTGSGPGNHGVYGFTDFKPQSYAIRFPAFTEMKAPTLWDRLGEKGRLSVVVNQPATYPAREIPGALVSGFVAIDLARAVHPPFLLRKLEQLGYEIDVDSARGAEDPENLFRQLESTLRGRERAWEYLWERGKWDFFELVVTGTDRLMHFQMHAIADSSDHYHQRCLDYYNKVDRFLGRVFDRFVAETNGGRTPEGFFVFSDHGFTEIRQEFYLNAWLCREGYLKFATAQPESLAEISAPTRAFCLDPTRIYLNRKDRFPGGVVEGGEIPELCAEIGEKLMAVEWDGEPVFRAAHRGDEIYAGAEAHRAPDLVMVARDGFDCKGWLRTGETFGRSRFTGMHTWDDAFLWTAEAMPEEFDITDIAGVIERRLLDGD